MSAAMVVAALSASAAGRLAVALSADRRRVLLSGGAWPAELDELLRIAVAIADNGGQLSDSGGQLPRSARPSAHDELQAVTAAARSLGVSTRTLQRLRADGAIATTYVGKRPRIRQSEIDRYLRENNP